MKDWIEKQREFEKNADPELVEKCRLARLASDYIAPTAYSSGRKIEEGDEIFYGLLLKDANRTENGLDMSYTLINFVLDEIGSVYEINNALTDANTTTLPMLIKVQNWIEKQREVVKTIDLYDEEHPEFLEARKSLGLTDEIKLTSGKVINENEEYFYGGLLKDDQKDDEKLIFTPVLFVLDELGVEYVVNEKHTRDISLYPMLNKIK